MDRWKFVNEKWIPRPVSRGEGFDTGIAAFSFRSLPHWGRGTAQRRSGALVNGVLETISPALFHTARTLSGSLRSPPSPRGEGVVSRKAVSSFRSLPHWERGTASAALRCSRIMAHLRRSSSLSFIPLVPYPARSARHLPRVGKSLLRDSSIYKIWKTCKPLNL